VAGITAVVAVGIDLVGIGFVATVVGAVVDAIAIGVIVAVVIVVGLVVSRWLVTGLLVRRLFGSRIGSGVGVAAGKPRQDAERCQHEQDAYCMSHVASRQCSRGSMVG